MPNPDARSPMPDSSLADGRSPMLDSGSSLADARSPRPGSSLADARSSSADSFLPKPDARSHSVDSFLPKPDARIPLTALCLSGGGSKGAWECGVIKYLAEQGLEFDCFAGTSVGAINAAFLAQYKNLLEGVAALEAQWRAVDDSKIRKPWNRVFGDFAAIDHESIYDSSPLWDSI